MTHAKVYKSKVSNGDGAYYEYEVQVNRDGEGQSFQHHQQVQQKQQPKRLEEQLYHSMISNLNQDNIQRQNQINQINEQRNQINNQQRNQINQQRNRFYQLERPQYSHRPINQFNNQQRQQYIREKLNNFGRTQ